METREITQVHVYFLLLNGVYDRCEARNITIVADSKEKIVNYYSQNLLPRDERFRDESGYYRSFRRDSLLYNYNDLPFNLNVNSECYDDLGIKDDWVELDSLDRIKSRYHWIEG